MANIKKMPLILLVLCILMSALLVITSCGGTEDPVDTSSGTESGNGGTNTDQTPKYVITVLDEYELGVEGVTVQLCIGENCLMPVKTDANGNATFESELTGTAYVTINSVPDGYEKPSEKVYLEEGQTTVTIELNSIVEYSVKAKLALFDKNLVNVVAELRRVSDNSVVSTQVTNEYGVAKFLAPNGEYYVSFSHKNPAFKLSNPDKEGEATKAYGTSRLINAEFIETFDTLDYKLNIKNVAGKAEYGIVVELYDESFTLIDTYYSNENGDIEFSAQNGKYIAVASFKNTQTVYAFSQYDSISGEMVLNTEDKGSSESYAELVLSMFGHNATSGKWYYTLNTEKKMIVVYSETATVVYNGKTYTPDNEGKISVVFENGNGVYQINGADAYVEYMGAPGTESNPIIIDSASINGYEITLDLLEGESYYYAFNANDDATITVTTNDSIQIVINEVLKSSLPVIKGDYVVIRLSSDGGKIEGAKVNFAFAKTYADYQITVNKDGQSAPDGTAVELYKYDTSTWEYQLVTSTTTKNGIAAFENVEVYAFYYVKVVAPADYETENEYEPFFNGATSTTIELSHVRDGSLEYPFLIDDSYAGGLLYDYDFTIGAGETLYFEAAPNNCVLSVSISGVIVQILEDKNSDGIYETVTDVDSSYVFEDKMNPPTILISIKNEGEAAEGSISFGANNGEVGSSYDNAIELDEAGAYTAEITEGKNVYYLYNGDYTGSTLKITVTDANGKLISVTATLAGTSESVETDNEITSDSGASLIFAISSQDADFTGNISFTITVE